MATIDLGKIKQVWRGTYNNGTAYTVDDLVEFTDSGITSSYICVANTTGNNPSSSGTAHASWNYVAKGVADPIPSQSGNTGKVLTTNGSAVSWGNGFEGTHYLGYTNFHRHGSNVAVNGASLANGNLDGNRDCVVINNGLYHTVTPSHVDDILEIDIMTTMYSNWGSSGSYWGFGFMSSTATDFSANRNIFFQSGQHSSGNGSGFGDEYRIDGARGLFDVSDAGLSVGTTYYIRAIGQVHSTNLNVNFNNAAGTRYDSQYRSYLKHYKRNV